MSSENPYQSTAAQVADGQSFVDTPEQIAGKIQNGWIAGLITAGGSMLFGLWQFFINQIPASFFGFVAVDALFVAALSFGVYRKSRVAAILLLVYYLLGRIGFYLEGGNLGGVFLQIIFLIFFYQAAQATLKWHRLERDQGDQA